MYIHHFCRPLRWSHVPLQPSSQATSPHRCVFVGSSNHWKNQRKTHEMQRLLRWFMVFIGFWWCLWCRIKLPLDDVGDVLKYCTKDENPALQNLELRNRQLEPLRGMSLARWIPCTSTDDLCLLQWELEEKGFHRFPWMSYEFWHVFYCFLICFNWRHPSQVAHPKKIERKVCSMLHMIWVSPAIFLGLDCFDCFDRSWSSPAMPEDWPTAIAPTSAYDMTSCDTSCGHREDRLAMSTSGAGHRGGWHAHCLGGVRCNEEGSVEKASRLSRLSRLSRISRGLSRNAFQFSRCFTCHNWQLWHVTYDMFHDMFHCAHTTHA